MRKIRIGTIHADFITMNEAIEQIVILSSRKRGGYVVTPNVDHVVVAEKNTDFREAYADASLSLVDGMPLLWLSRILGFPLPEKISGSDLVYPLLQRAADSGLSVYLLGSAPGVGARAAVVLGARFPGLRIVGVDAPPMGFEKDAATETAVLEEMLAAQPDIVLVALGSPKQEVLMHRWCKKGISPVLLGIGATIDFIAGDVKRAPRWMSKIGAEWLYRLVQEPKRLARRYLIQDTGFIKIIIRMLRMPRDQIVYYLD